jgi:hypothetical protein
MHPASNPRQALLKSGNSLFNSERSLSGVARHSPYFSLIGVTGYQLTSSIWRCEQERSMVKVVLIAFGLILAVFSFARAGAACGELPGALSCRVPTTGPQDTRDWQAAELLCCCKTYSEGECCSRAPKCGGKLPGCFCTSPSVPGRPGSSAATVVGHR